MRGDTPSARVKASKKQPNNTEGSSTATQPHGTKADPLVVDTQGHQQTPIERKEAEKQATEAKADKDVHNALDVSTRNWTAFAAIATGILVLVGIGGTIAAICTLRAIKSQEALSRDTAQRQLRAYVCVHAVAIHFTDAETVDVRVDIKNSGQTPAYQVRQWIRVFIGTYPLAESLPEPPDDFDMSASVIGPDGFVSIARRPRPPVDAVALGTPTKTVYAYGKVYYKDAFGESRTTGYRFYYGGNEPPGATRHPDDGHFIGILRAHAEGNEAD
jgi:hypothetical protein